MKNSSLFLLIFLAILMCQGSINQVYGQDKLTINDQGYFEMPGLDVMVFDDYYPSGHQSGITIIQNGIRVAANGDIRLGMFSEKGQKKIDKQTGTIEAQLKYPDVPLGYTVRVTAQGHKILVSADLDQALPEDMAGKSWFQIELFPSILFGKSWSMDGQSGFFPTDSYSPMIGAELEPYAEGKILTVAPETNDQRLTIKALKGNIQLVDGRKDSKAGWFIVRAAIPKGETKKVIEWEIEAVPLKDFTYSPVIHISQVGYLPSEHKRAVIELDKRTTKPKTIEIMKINSDGTQVKVMSAALVTWGKYLRYNYAICDFSIIKDPGIYQIRYGDVTSNLFKVGNDIYDRYVWQPTLEYFLPVQMCHMRIEQGTRVWHDWCHLDDAVMAPVNLIHFDGYRQGPETFTRFSYPEHVPFLDRGGWHDAGDYDLRIESQAVTTWRLAQMYEIFHIDLDATTVDQEKRIVTIHKPDGIPDALQQVEHGVYTILGGYKGMGRLYRGMINPTRKQYGLQGDGSAQTDNLIYSQELPEGAKTAYNSSIMDDNWVFTEDNARHELTGVASLAAAARVLKAWRPEMSDECLKAAEDLYLTACKKEMVNERIQAAAELYITTKSIKFLDDITSQKEFILAHMQGTAWAVAMVYNNITDAGFREDMEKAVKEFSAQLEKEDAENPFGVPYKPDIWGAGWTIQSLGVQQYFLVKGFPGVFKPDRIFSSMQFVLGCHPGRNTASFASGVGYKSLTQAYGVNRADLSYIPGGVASGTAIIRPDLPELKDNWSFLWQQTEYVMGGGETNFMFLVLATNQLLKK
ncbi:MAG: glycoside hydrolase family 9 protein [Bacteroidota bacterium]|nr:glycoside hydrolase family 9 protein [Bacteroidota bacterium]